MLSDTRGRGLTDLRISLTDRCNFRCVYCMPKAIFDGDFPFLKRTDLLTFEEITRLAHLFVAAGVRKIRLTGGEPLVRAHVENLVRMLRAIPGLEDIAMTTNGSLLTPDKARVLRDAGLDRVTISLDSLDDAVFGAVNDVAFPVSGVLQAIDAAASAGLSPVKINMVVKKGVNDDDVLTMASHFRGTPHILRLIEYMDVGNANGWQLEDVVSAGELREKIHHEWPLVALEASHVGEVARRYRYQDGQGEIGFINSVSQPFCHACTRARLSPEGQLFTCLFGNQGRDFRDLLRHGASDQEIAATIGKLWSKRDDHYSEIRTDLTESIPKVEMFHIGG